MSKLSKIVFNYILFLLVFSKNVKIWKVTKIELLNIYDYSD